MNLLGSYDDAPPLRNNNGFFLLVAVMVEA